MASSVRFDYVSNFDGSLYSPVGGRHQNDLLPVRGSLGSSWLSSASTNMSIRSVSWFNLSVGKQAPPCGQMLRCMPSSQKPISMPQPLGKKRSRNDRLQEVELTRMTTICGQTSRSRDNILCERERFLYRDNASNQSFTRTKNFCSLTSIYPMTRTIMISRHCQSRRQDKTS